MRRIVRIVISKSRSKIKLLSIVSALVGILFLSVAVLMWQFGGDVLGISFPRNDIAHVGFAVVGAVYIIIAIALYLTLKNKVLI